MSALLNPANRAGGSIKWLLVAHAAVMFSLVTVFTAMYLDLQPSSYVDNREFPGTASLPSGPLGYQHLIYSEAISLVPRVIFMLNNWLADGLLVSSAFSSVIWASNIGQFSSFIVAASSIP